MSLPSPSLLGSHTLQAGELKVENGRDTGGQIEIPPVPSSLCTSAFEAYEGRKGGIITNSSVIRIWSIKGLHLFHLQIAINLINESS